MEAGRVTDPELIAGLYRAAFAPSTVSAYEREWQRFETFVREQGFRDRHLSDQLVYYIVHMALTGRGRKAPWFLSAARYILNEKKLPLDAITPFVQNVAAGGQRNQSMLTRDGGSVRLPFRRLHWSMLEKAIPEEDEDRLRDLVMLALGLRLYLRGGEFTTLTRSDVSFPDASRMEIKVRRHKTRATRPKDSHEIVDASPHPPLVRLMKEFLRQRGDHDGPLFLVDGAPPGPREVTEIIRRRMRQAGVPDVNVYSSHSLRIGGASEDARNGVSTTVIAARGGWEPGSTAVQGYLRMMEDLVGPETNQE